MSNKVWFWNNILCPMIEVIGFMAIIMGYFGIVGLIIQALEFFGVGGL